MWKTKSTFDTIPPSFPPFLRYLVLHSPLLSSLCRCHLRLIPVCHLFLLGSRWGHYHCVGPPFGSKTLRLNLCRWGWISLFIYFFFFKSGDNFQPSWTWPLLSRWQHRRRGVHALTGQFYLRGCRPSICCQRRKKYKDYLLLWKRNTISAFPNILFIVNRLKECIVIIRKGHKKHFLAGW